MKINRQDVFDKYNGHCAYCGNPFNSIKDMQVDHIIAKQATRSHHLLIGDINDINNLNPACRSCNKFKDTFSIEIFRKNIESQISKFRNYHPTFNLAERYGIISCNESAKVEFYFEKIKH